MGKILYTPPSPATDRVMAEVSVHSAGGLQPHFPPSDPLPVQVNRTFQELAALRDTAGAALELGAQIRAILNGSQELRALRVCAQSGGCVGPGGTAWGQEGLRGATSRARGLYCTDAWQELLLAPGTALLLDGLLNGTSQSVLAQLLAGPAGLSWQQALDEAERALGALSQLLGCVRLDKIEAVGSEEQLVARAMELLEERQFWAAVVFQPPLNTTAMALPPHVRYKIRMDIDDVTRTDKIKDRLGDAAPPSIPSLAWGVVCPPPPPACCSTPGFGTQALKLTHSTTCTTCGVALSTCRTWWNRRWCGCRRGPPHGWGSICSRCHTPAMWMTCECCRTPSDPLRWGMG